MRLQLPNKRAFQISSEEKQTNFNLIPREPESSAKSKMKNR